jgi:hypothetical protein
MSGTMLGFQIRNNILNGTYNAGTLQTFLGTAANMAAFRILMNDRASVLSMMENSTAFATITGSALALDVFINSSQAMKAAGSSETITRYITESSAVCEAVLSNITGYSTYQYNLEYKARIQRRVNATGSKLKREVFYADGTFTIPGGGLAAMAIGMSGGGAGGNDNTAGSGARPGGAAQFGTLVIYSGLPGVNQSVTVGAGGAGSGSTFGTDGEDSVVGALITVEGGNADMSAAGTSTGALALVTETDLENAFWFFYDVEIAGAEAYEAGLTGAAGSDTVAATGLCSGGGDNSATGGNNAAGFGCGGNSGTTDGGQGSDGIVTICYIEA